MGLAVDHPHVGDDPLIIIELGIKINARNGDLGSPAGRGTRSMIARNTSGTPSPVLALTARTSAGSIPRLTMISSLISSGRAACMSILFKTGTIARLLFTAR